MTDSPALRWLLQVPFIAAPGFELESIRLAMLSDFEAKLRPTASGYTNIVVGGLESKSAAYELFELMRIGLFAASLNSNWGIRVRAKALTLDYDTPVPSEVDVPLIYPEGKDLSRLVISHGPVRKQVDKVWPKLVGGISFGLTSDTARVAMNDDRVKLASELYTESYFESSDSARLIGFIGVLEVLKDKRPRSEPAQDLVKRWKAEASDTLDASEAASIRGSLEWLNSISIAGGISSVVSRHLGKDRAREAQALYTMRSELVHDGKRLIDASNIVRAAEQIVTELLAHILTSGSL